MHADAAYWALLGDEAAPDSPALAALLAAWQGTGSRAARDLFEQPPARLAELLGCDEEALAPLLARRPLLAQARRLVERLPAGVDMVARGERRYPRALVDALGVDAPRALWYLGALSMPAANAAALFGTRDGQQESLATARAMAGQIAAEGRVLVTGIARPLERAALDTALAVGGAAVVVLGMGIAVAQPEIRRLLPHVVAERLLLLSALGPQTPWQPGLEGRRVEVAMALVERVYLVAPGDAGDALEVARAAERLARPLVVWPAGAVADVPGALPWTPASPLPEDTSTPERQSTHDPSGALEALKTPGHTRPHSPVGSSEAHSEWTHNGGTESKESRRIAALTNERGDQDSTSSSAPAATLAAHVMDQSTSIRKPRMFGTPAEVASTTAKDPDARRDQETSAKPVENAVVRAESAPTRQRAEASSQSEAGMDPAETVLRYLTLTRRKVTSKGRLLQALGMREADLDHVLPALIAEGRVVQMRHRSGAGYAAVRDGEPPPAGSTFQLSLFGQVATSENTPECPCP